MQPFLHLINESNKLSLNKPADSNQVYYSELREWYTSNAFRSFSIKFVVDGAIYYKSGHKEFRVDKNQFLLTSKQENVKAYFDSKQLVKSICIDICPASLAEAFATIYSGDDIDLDNQLAGYFNHPYFFEKVYDASSSLFSNQLFQLSNALCSGQIHKLSLDDEWFLQLIELIILQEKDTCTALGKIAAKKPATRKEVYARLLKGKAFMDEQFWRNPGIAEVACYSNLSNFHFFRSFRQAFGISPYQYMTQLRLQQAALLINENSHNLSGIAVSCGFTDLFTFSKAFKKRYGIPPSKFYGTDMN